MYYNILINGLMKNTKYKKALNYLNEMQQNSFILNNFSISVISQLINKLDG